MKRLIVNADDLGADEPRNAGIFEAIAAGAVTSVSLLANGPAFDDAVRGLRGLPERTVSVGLHFNLSEGEALAQGHELLAAAGRRFRGKAPAHALLLEEGNERLRAEIRRELDAQIERLRDAGLRMLHLDGHQHVHVFPAVFSEAVSAARRCGIPWIRIPDEEVVSLDETARGAAGSLSDASRFRGLGRTARGRLAGTGMSAADGFRGLALMEEFTSERLMAQIRALPQGLTELMVHPGRACERARRGPFSAFSTAAREAELAVLLDAALPAALDRLGVRRVPFPEPEVQ